MKVNGLEKFLIGSGILVAFFYLTFVLSERGDISGKVIFPSIEGNQVYYIEIKKFEFIPSYLELKEGDNVVWFNRDSADHLIEIKKLGESILLGEGEDYKYSFDKSGEYFFSCGIHTDEVGLVRVLK